MKKIYTLILLFSFCSTLFVLKAQKTYLADIELKNSMANKHGNELIISMDIDISELSINRQQMITLMPMLKAKDENVQRNLPPIVVTGPTRDKVLRRRIRLSNEPVFEIPPHKIVRRKNGKQQVIPYSVTVPVENWMKRADLMLIEAVSGCAACELGQSQTMVIAKVLPDDFIPVYTITYIQPEVEPVKRRSAKHAAHFNYKVARYELLPNFGNNASELAEVDRVITSIQNDSDVTITDLTITGYASPEGSVRSNMALSRRRADTFASYLVSKYGLQRNQFKVNWYGEDWKGLEYAIKSSHISDKEAVLNIIHTIKDPDARDAKLKQLSAGETYRMLLQQYYPPLRRNEYTVAYVARAFDVEEAKEIIKTKPQLLSLNEMYLVAQTYPADSKGFKEVFDIAARLYPDDPIAVLNRSAADIEGQDMQDAINRLEKISDNPRVWNNLGVAYARIGNIEKATLYFEKAATNGDKDAVSNLKQLEKYMEQEK